MKDIVIEIKKNPMGSLSLKGDHVNHLIDLKSYTEAT